MEWEKVFANHTSDIENIIRNPNNTIPRKQLILKIDKEGTSLVVQLVRFHAPNAGGPGSIPGWGTRSHMPATTKKPAHATKKSTCHN